MKDYVIITDGNADLPADYAAENGMVKFMVKAKIWIRRSFMR